MRRGAAAFAGLVMLAGPAGAATPGPGALALLDQFMIARSAAARCGQAAASTAAAFQHKYELVTLRAEAMLTRLASDLAGANIGKLIENRYNEIDRRVSTLVTQESCNGPHVQQALQKYDSVANIKDTELMAENDN